VDSASLLPRQRLARLLPPGVRQLALAVWRKLYWWNASRIRPGRARRKAQRLLASGNPIKLELGSGPREEMEGWISVDIGVSADIQLDLRKPLPFPADSVDAVYSSHMLEHFTYPTPMLNLLREVHRILKPGAKISVAVPNARLFLEAYADPSGFPREKFCSWDVGLHFTSRIDVVNFIAFLGGEHKFLFDEENLPLVLEETGFRDVRIREFEFAIDLECRRDESIYAEAVK
jgi:predicted SAM-dependent methyltransferase